jgi:O-antigen/teichoic acid export membrane protein
MPVIPSDLGEFSGELSPSPNLPPMGSARFVRGRRILRVLTSFFLGQGAAQGISVLAGLFLVHKLSVEAYAQFGLASGFQSLFSILMDFGFASTIIPMVGEQKDDRALVGRYVRSAKHLRDWAFWIIAPVTVVAFLAIMHKQHWSMTVQLLLLASVLLALYSGGRVSYYSAPLFIFGRLREYYIPQIATGACRLAAYIGLEFAGGLNAWTAAGLSALNVTANGSWLAKKSRPYLEWPEREDPATDRELFHYILPAAPAMIFAAFQSQITLFLISIFGGTVDIAQVAALGRIGQLFSVLMTFNMIVIEPYVARLARERLLSTYLKFLVLACVAGTPVVLIAFAWPGAFLWLIGSKYEAIRGLLGWIVLAGCLNYLAGLMWIMNRARKWLFWSGTILEVVLLLVLQTAYILYVGVNTTREAVFLTFAMSFCYLIAHGYVSVYGFIKGPRTLQGLSA